MLLGRGELRRSERGFDQQIAQHYFILRLNTVSPAVGRTLYEEIYPLCKDHLRGDPYLRMIGLMKGEDVRPINRVKLIELILEKKSRTALEQYVLDEHMPLTPRGIREDEFTPSIQMAVRQWAAGFNLNVEWFHYLAMISMRSWYMGLPYGKFPNIPLSYVYLYKDRFVLKGWRPDDQTWQEYRSYVDERLSEYRTSVLRQARDLGLEPVPRKREPIHFDWLIRYQVQEWSFRRIEERYHRSPRAVRDGMERTAELMGLHLKRRSRGRPPKL